MLYIQNWGRLPKTGLGLVPGLLVSTSVDWLSSLFSQPVPNPKSLIINVDPEVPRSSENASPVMMAPPLLLRSIPEIR